MVPDYLDAQHIWKHLPRLTLKTSKFRVGPLLIQEPPALGQVCTSVRVYSKTRVRNGCLIFASVAVYSPFLSIRNRPRQLPLPGLVSVGPLGVADTGHGGFGGRIKLRLEGHQVPSPPMSCLPPRPPSSSSDSPRQGGDEHQQQEQESVKRVRVTGGVAPPGDWRRTMAEG